MSSRPKEDARLAGGWGDELDALAPPPVEAGRPKTAPAAESVTRAGGSRGLTELEMPSDIAAGGGLELELDWGERGQPPSRPAAQPDLPLPDLDVAPSAPASSVGVRPSLAGRGGVGPAVASATVSSSPRGTLAPAWTPSSPKDTLVIASMGKRIVAHIVDSFAVGGMTYGLFFVWMRSQVRRFESMPAQQITEAQANSLFVSILGVAGVVTVLGLLYYVLPTTVWGWSPGKKLMGLRVVDSDGNTPSLGRVLLREVLGKWISSMFCSFGYLMAFFDPENRALHDRIATTSVVED